MNSLPQAGLQPHKTLVPSWNPLLEGLRCLRCSVLQPMALLHTGCPLCAAHGHHVSLAASYRSPPAAGVHLPFDRSPSLGEGATPLVDLPRFARQAGIARLTLKDESRNPTGSHKDRMSAFGAAHALAAGVHTVVLASSGNAAISAAAYCEAAGLACEVAGYADMPAAYVQELERHGAQRLAFPDNAARWAHVSRRARQHGVLALTNHQLPALGSAPLAIEGYKLIAQEIAQAGDMPDHILVPTSRGDLAWGIYRGLRELLESGQVTTMPRLWAVEPFARLSRVLAGEDLHGTFEGTTAQFSTAGSTVTWLQMEAVTRSGGGAACVSDDSAHAARAALADAGISAELCSAGALAALQQLAREGRIGAGEHAMLILTASARRDPSSPPSTSPGANP